MIFKLISTLVLAGGIGAGAYNVISAEYPLRQTISDDPVGQRSQIFAYHQFGLNPSSIVFDIWDVPLDASAADVTRILFDFASAIDDRQFDSVYLAYRGRLKFVMSGDDFQDIGRQREAGQNPLYLIQTLPEKLRYPDGREAFSHWDGGWLGVSTHQLEDFAELHRQWYAEDMSRRAAGL